jgi:Protein of unknown function (DUF3489)
MKLTETQITTLTAATQRPDGNIEPLPEHVNAGLKPRVIQGLVTRQLVDYINNTYVINANGLTAIGMNKPKAPPQRQGTKQALVIALLKRPEGVCIDELCEATGWQKHTVRGVFSNTLKNRLGLTISSEKSQGQPRRYRIVEQQEDADSPPESLA